MQHINSCTSSGAEIPLRRRHTSPSEQTNEAHGAIEQDQVEIEREVPADESWPVEQSGPSERSEPPLPED